MPTIDDWRKKIDKVDKKLVNFLNERARFAQEIGKLKQRLGLDAYSPEREEEILRNVMEWNEGPLPVDVLRRLYERILDESRTLERTAILNRQQKSPPEGSSLRSPKSKRKRSRG